MKRVTRHGPRTRTGLQRTKKPSSVPGESLLGNPNSTGDTTPAFARARRDRFRPWSAPGPLQSSMAHVGDPARSPRDSHRLLERSAAHMHQRTIPTDDTSSPLADRIDASDRATPVSAALLERGVPLSPASRNTAHPALACLPLSLPKTVTLAACFLRAPALRFSATFFAVFCARGKREGSSELLDRLVDGRARAADLSGRAARACLGGGLLSLGSHGDGSEVGSRNR